MNKALVVVDVQNDFCEGGALAVPESNEIIPIVNTLITQFENVYYTVDSHPDGHYSFASTHDKEPFDTVIDKFGREQVLWPDHCLIGSTGRAFPETLNVHKSRMFVFKGEDVNVDSYSGFFDNNKQHTTMLDRKLKEKNIDTLYICGLALDYCVMFTALDAVELGYKTYVITDACKPVYKSKFGSVIDRLKDNNIIPIKSTEISF